MTTQLDSAYFEWLISQIQVNGTRTFNELFGRMHDTEFLWTVPNDDNRIGDALELRPEFLDHIHSLSPREIKRFRSPTERPVSVLEVLIALSRRLTFYAGHTAPVWAWKLIKNLGLNKASDPLDDVKAQRVEDTLYALIWRTYEPDGVGGFFPLNWAKEDQTKIEIWDQMNQYIMENFVSEM